MPDDSDPLRLENWPGQMLQAAATVQRLQFMLATHWWTMAMAPGLLAFPYRWPDGLDHQLRVPDPLERDAERALFA
ncbi:hypothetical protein OKW76_00860 [Sphingomonas sp. S1-29]|uniref:hypothetical protein n=1 Tax=Sphingomonas sp. S1-29 TaxID=2991074 RepID=UPI002240D25A|nr:hypothetical protein [Sphingomonas sp. S1-29]UZK69675.1 hypothetical protein OKW76_00860 [Sphingomonas sp. S1-29]